MRSCIRKNSSRSIYSSINAEPSASLFSLERAKAAHRNRSGHVRRILKILAIGVLHRHDSIVLGAWGCGAFGNDPDKIAELFERALGTNFRGAYR